MENVLNINIIGNGFDKMHGIDSTYHDFLTYLKKDTNLVEGNYILQEMINKQLNDTWIDCESYLNDLFTGFIQFKELQLKVDINHEVDTFISYANNKYVSIKKYKRSGGDNYKYINLGEVINAEAFKHNFSVYEIHTNDILKLHGSSETFLMEKIQKDLLDDFYNLRKELISYLKTIENNFNFNTTFEDFLIENNFVRNSICLNFNYTNTANKYFGDIYHLHGDLINENIVWGYYDCQMENICKVWQTLCLNAGNDFYYNLAKSLETKPVLINLNILGHSVSANDLKIYNKIIKLIEAGYQCQFSEPKDLRSLFKFSINYTYYDEERQMGNDQISKVKNIKELGDAANYAINSRKLKGHNTKYEF